MGWAWIPTLEMGYSMKQATIRTHSHEEDEGHALETLCGDEELGHGPKHVNM